MKNTVRQLFHAPTLALALLGACDAPPEDGWDEPESAEDLAPEASFRATLPMRLSTERSNTNNGGGFFFSELRLDGLPHENTVLHRVDYFDPPAPPPGFTHADHPLDYYYPPPFSHERIEVDATSIDVVQRELHAWRMDGGEVYHSEFRNTLWTFSVTDDYGTPLAHFEMRVTPKVDPTSGTPLYEFDWRAVSDPHHPEPAPVDPLPGVWNNSCVTPGHPELTAAVYADLDVNDAEFPAGDGSMSYAPGLLYIGCTGGAVGKASLWELRFDDGYLTDPSLPGTPLERFEAAVRMIRADYFGTGEPFTIPNTRLEVTHGSLPNQPSNQQLSVEAAWGLGGVMCLDSTRLPLSTPNLQGQWAQVPWCTGNEPDVLFSTRVFHGVNNGVCEEFIPAGQCEWSWDRNDCGC